ncbi:hypothetical protein V1506DRAFT_563163 [Lipomyces tetrasporus]
MASMPNIMVVLMVVLFIHFIYNPELTASLTDLLSGEPRRMTKHTMEDDLVLRLDQCEELAHNTAAELSALQLREARCLSELEDLAHNTAAELSALQLREARCRDELEAWHIIRRPHSSLMAVACRMRCRCRLGVMIGSSDSRNVRAVICVSTYTNMTTQVPSDLCHALC